MAAAGDDPPRPERLHALDAVRGFALLLGIFLHATMSFFPDGARFWVIADTHPSLLLGLFTFVAHSFRMTTFFLIAGFFAHLSYHRLGAGSFVHDRARRIAVPLAVGWPIVSAAFVAIYLWAAAIANGGTLSALPSPAVMLSRLTLTHLWFLYVLLEFYALALVLRAALSWLDRRDRIKRGIDRLIAILTSSRFAPIVLALPVAAALVADPAWTIWPEIRTPERLITNLQAFVGYGVAFGFGWLLHRQADLIRGLQHRWALNLALATLMMIGCIVLGEAPPAALHAGGLRAARAVSYAIGGWAMTFAVIGLALRFLSGYSATRRYIADASYWLYLVHLPIVMALQVAVARLDWPWPVKYFGIVAITLALGFASYQWLVRTSFIGAVLNGRRAKPVPAAAQIVKAGAQV